MHLSFLWLNTQKENSPIKEWTFLESFDIDWQIIGFRQLIKFPFLISVSRGSQGHIALVVLFGMLYLDMSYCIWIWSELMGMLPPSRETGLCGRGPGSRGAVPLPHHHPAKLFPEAPGGAQGTRHQTPCYGASQNSPSFQAAPSS